MRFLHIIALAAAVALGDGGVVAPQGQAIAEFGQVAIIKHEVGIERLIISTGLYGSATDFGWVIPLPSSPSVDSVDWDAFQLLLDHTRPLYRSRGGFGCGRGYDYLAPGELGRDSLRVEELEAGRIGDYEYEVLLAREPDSLARYLAGHGYELPDGAAGVFGHYTGKAWCHWVVARVRDSIERYEARAVGIELMFATDSAVYPMYISRLGGRYPGGYYPGDGQQVVLYVLADHRQMFDGSALRFSGAVGPGTIPGLDWLIDHDLRLTRLVRWFGYDEMADVCLRPAPDDGDYRHVEYAGAWWSGLAGLSLVLVAAVLLRRRLGVGRPRA